MTHPRHILAAVDGSDESDAALDRAVAMANEAGASLFVVTVADYSPIMKAVDMEPDVLKQIGEGVDPFQAVLSVALARAEKDGVRARGAVLRERQGVAAAIVRHAEAEGADLIVIGSRGATGLRRVLLGSVAKDVVERAHCPVLVVR
ncbi:MAG TPA: universal stress protein [Candidatus Thermoplasmatota archaeon]